MNNLCPPTATPDTPPNGFSPEAVKALEDAIAQGVKVVRINNRLIEYQSVGDMIKAMEYMKKNLQACTKKRPTAFRMRST